MTSRLWEVVKNIILERLTRKPKLKRPSISQPKLLEWVECMDPEVELSDIPEYSKNRIEDLEEITKLITKRNLERQRVYGNSNVAASDEASSAYNSNFNHSNHSERTPEKDSAVSSNTLLPVDKQLDDRIYDAIWSPSTWLH